ncbi:LOW QUALITY PROTEIN: outer dense fiber protein 2-like [Clinocottus analis]|uniref:LOW QUALITY PROTEIN: outer dense fiber protein 2-like n=1 Tax=Clinocottus analis TaxID=304258 RepID=UPI0035BFFF15
MKTRDLPPPVHVHVPETTPVHVHMRRSPTRTPQIRTKDAPVRGDGGRPKVRTPWIPPGRHSCRRDVDSFKFQRSRAERRSESGVGRQRDNEELEEELAVASKNLKVLLGEQESMQLQKSHSRRRHRETGVLLRALVETEIDGVAVANQLTGLKETIDSLAKDKRLSKLHAASLGRQQELLLEKIEMFDNTNQSLRELLREWSKYEKESFMWLEQKDALQKRLTVIEAENIGLLAKLSIKEKEASKLCANAVHLDFEKDNVKTTEDLSRLLQSTRGHLESELNKTEAEKVHLAAQIQDMQQNHQQQQEELQALQEELQALRQRREEEEEEEGRREQKALTLLTRQAEHAQESNRQLAAKLQEKESQLAQTLSTSSDWCLRLSRESAVRGKLEEDVSALKLQAAELSAELHSAEGRIRAEREEFQDCLHRLRAENASTKQDNQRLRGQLTSSEEKLHDLQSEARRLKASIKKHESLAEKYKTKVQHLRLESEEHCLKLEEAQEKARGAKVSLQREVDQGRRELLARLQELEAMPDRLKAAEQQLQSARQEVDAHERRNEERSAALSEVRHKVEQQGTQLETFQQRNLLLQEENDVLTEKIHNLERTLEDMRVENEGMSQALPSKEATIRSVQQQLEEKTHECSIVSRQLQQALDDAQRQVDGSMQRVLAKERASQSKALDLQSQLSRAQTEQSQLQRSKEEMERRFQSQLQNMKDRLEQSDSTNRSLQNYVHFLKTSYGNVFDDSSFTG